MFRSGATFLGSFKDHPIHKVMDALARPRDVEVKCHSKMKPLKTIPAKEKKKGALGKQAHPQGQAVGH